MCVFLRPINHDSYIKVNLKNKSVHTIIIRLAYAALSRTRCLRQPSLCSLIPEQAMVRT